MNLTTEATTGFAIIRVSGRLTASSAPALRAEVQEVVAGGVARIVVDLGGTTFVDSSGLGTLIGALKTTRVAGGDLRIAAVPDTVRTVLRLTSLDRVLRAHDRAETAFQDE